MERERVGEREREGERGREREGKRREEQSEGEGDEELGRRGVRESLLLTSLSGNEGFNEGFNDFMFVSLSVSNIKDGSFAHSYLSYWVLFSSQH